MDNEASLEEKEHDGETQIELPDSVMAKISELMGGTDEFDSPNFDPIAYMNARFPTEQSLVGVESACAKCEFALGAAKQSARELLRGRSPALQRGQSALKEAKGTYKQLMLQLEEINKLSTVSEDTVRGITREMKQLDRGKRNLTAAIGALTQLRLLHAAGRDLQVYASTRQYAEALPALHAATQVLSQLSSYKDISQVQELRRRVLDTRDQLNNQIMDDFKKAFNGLDKSIPESSLLAGCELLEAGGDEAPSQLKQWIVQQVLQEYIALFSSEQEWSWLPEIDRRLVWVKKELLSFERGRGKIIPHQWGCSQAIAREFCKITRDSLSELMSARASELSVPLLLHAVHKCTEFESLLEKRFKENDEQDSQAIEGSWSRAISSCFEPHLSLYIASVERALNQLIDDIVKEWRNSDSANPLSGCGRILLLYKEALLQCTKLSDGMALLELSSVFGRGLQSFGHHLREWAKVNIPTGNKLTLANIPALLRDDAHTRLSKQDICRITDVITTAEYCLESTIHLEQKLKEKINNKYEQQINLTSEQQLYYNTISDCIQLLVHDLEVICEPALVNMSKVSWLQYEAAVEQSSYVTQLIMHMKNYIPIIRDSLASSRKYFTQFCIRFANSFIPKFIQNIYKCKPISTVGSKQLLLDTHMLKNAFLELPSLGSEVKRAAPNTFTKEVVKLMSKAEMIVKLVMAPFALEHLDEFVGECVRVLRVGDSSLVELHKLMEMKGVKLNRQQQSEMDDLYRRKIAHHDNH